MLNENENLIEKKAQQLFSNSLPVHVEYKKGFWKNGYITEMSSDFFMLDEFFEGLMPVFFIEIFNIEKYKKGVEKDGTK